jgi:hypothetical protein
MASEYLLREEHLTPGAVREQLRLHGWTLVSIGAGLGFAGGIGAALLGSILTAMSWFIRSSFHGFTLQRGSTVLMCLTIPLLFFGAHCLDLLDRKESQRSKK